MTFYFSFTVYLKYAALDNTDKSDDENNASSIMKINLKATSETEMTVDSNKPNANITNIHPNIEEHGHVDVHVKTLTTHLPSKVFIIT